MNKYDESEHDNSVYHAVLNAFQESDTFTLGTTDIINYVAYNGSRTVKALDAMVENEILHREKVGGVYVYMLWAPYINSRPVTQHRLKADEIASE